jgi:hypothetical protein
MKKQHLTLFLILSWLMGLVAVFSSPPPRDLVSKDSAGHSVIQKITTPDLLVRNSPEQLEVPSFQFDWRMVGFGLPSYSIHFFTVLPIFLATYFYAGSKPLFEVLITFFYFFYTW